MRELLRWLLRKIMGTVTLGAIIMTSILTYRFFDEKFYCIRPFPYSFAGILMTFIVICFVLTYIYLSMYHNEEDKK